jgi:cation diffusion facilitator family transporter
MASHEGKGAIFASLAANLGIAASKFIAFLLTGASSMLAESIHSVADSSNQVLLLIGGKRAKKEATKTHPFGYGRAHFLYAFIVSIVLFTLGGLFAIYEGIHKIQHPEELNNPIVAYVVLGIAMTLEGLALRTVLKEAKSFKPTDQNWWNFIRKSKSVNHIVLAMEDTAALLGLCFALTGITLSLITGNGVWDGIGTLFIGGLLVVVAIILFAEVKSLLIGEGADDDTLAIIEEEILKVEVVNSIVDLKTLYVGPAEMFIAMKVTVDAEDSASVVSVAIDEIEARIRHRVPFAKLIYVEPDLQKSPEQHKALDDKLAALLNEETPKAETS